MAECARMLRPGGELFVEDVIGLMREWVSTERQGAVATAVVVRVTHPRSD